MRDNLVRSVPRIRSMLFMPANRTDWADKGVNSGADALIFDLEDAVAARDKDAARQTLSAYLKAVDEPPVPLFVRLNELSSGAPLADLRAVVGPAVTGVLVPKVIGRDDIVIVDRLLTWLEEDLNLEPGSTLIVPVLETALGIRNAFEIAKSSERVAYMGALGGKGGDVERSIGYQWSPEGAETFVMRSNVLLEARAAEVVNPVTGLWSDIRDLDGLKKFAQQCRSLGYEGMVAIHPSHVSIINEAFTTTVTELQRDRSLITAMDQAEQRGEGAIIFEGEMVDRAMVETALKRLSKYQSGS